MNQQTINIKVVLIAAMDRNGAIGSGNALPWHCPQDMRHFVDKTFGKVVVMGRKTADSLKKPLKNRTNVVLSRSGYERAGFLTVRSLEEAGYIAHGLDQGEIWVIGGGELYQQTIDIADVVHLTALNIEVPNADTWFPADRLGQFKGAVCQTCTDPNVHFWTFSREATQSTRQCRSTATTMELDQAGVAWVPPILRLYGFTPPT